MAWTETLIEQMRESSPRARTAFALGVIGGYVVEAIALLDAGDPARARDRLASAVQVERALDDVWRTEMR